MMATRTKLQARVRGVAVLGGLLGAMTVPLLASSAGAVQSCSGPGTGETPPTGADSVEANLDGDGDPDTVHFAVDLLTDDVLILAVLDNGYTTSITDAYQGAGDADIEAIRDIDRDGDDEIVASFGAQPQFEANGLFTLLDCELTRLADVSGTSPTFNTGQFGAGANSVDCYAPSAGGRGVSNYSVETVDGTSFDYERTEYRLIADDREGTFEWVVTREELIEGLPATDARVIYAGGGAEGPDGVLRCVAPAVCDGERVNVQGTPIDDIVAGTPAADIVALGAGHDQGSTGGGADVVCAGAGNDDVRLGRGADRGFGQSGADVLGGQGGPDLLNGGGGADMLNGGPGPDTGNGGPGQDSCVVEVMRSCEIV